MYIEADRRQGSAVSSRSTRNTAQDSSRLVDTLSNKLLGLCYDKACLKYNDYYKKSCGALAGISRPSSNLRDVPPGPMKRRFVDDITILTIQFSHSS